MALKATSTHKSAAGGVASPRWQNDQAGNPRLEPAAAAVGLVIPAPVRMVKGSVPVISCHTVDAKAPLSRKAPEFKKAEGKNKHQS